MRTEWETIAMLAAGVFWMWALLDIAIRAVHRWMYSACRHDRETIHATEWSVWRSCPDCQRRVRLGSVMSSEWCHATVKRRDAA